MVQTKYQIIQQQNVIVYLVSINQQMYVLLDVEQENNIMEYHVYVNQDMDYGIKSVQIAQQIQLQMLQEQIVNVYQKQLYLIQQHLNVKIVQIMQQVMMMVQNVYVIMDINKMVISVHQFVMSMKNLMLKLIHVIVNMDF